VITENNIKTLDNLVKKYALLDFFRANPKPIKQYKNGKTSYKQYTLSPLTNEAREMLNLARQKKISREDELSVKGYLLMQKFNGETVDDFDEFRKRMFKERWRVS